MPLLLLQYLGPETSSPYMCWTASSSLAAELYPNLILPIPYLTLPIHKPRPQPYPAILRDIRFPIPLQDSSPSAVAAIGQVAWDKDRDMHPSPQHSHRKLAS